MPEYRLPWTGETPVLETERLRLRGITIEDWPFIRDRWANPQFTRYIGAPLSEEESWGKFLRSIGQWVVMGFGYWAVDEKQTGAVIGEIGFMHYKRIMEPAIEDGPEIGWGFAPSTHGKGYASEAALCAVEWGDAHFKTSRMTCIIDPANKGSIRVAEKCGFGEVRRATYKGDEIIVLHRPIAPRG